MGFFRGLLGSLILPACTVVLAAPPGDFSTGARFRQFVYKGTDAVQDRRPPGIGEYANPVLAGFYPDPTILRVGSDYYLANSSFAYSPGIPLFHSTDLVHWQQLGSILIGQSEPPLSHQAVRQGIYAPVLRRSHGLFYLITTQVGGIGNFYVTASNIAGPWGRPVPLPEIDGIDPSFFFDDDGKAYIVHNGPPPGNKPLYEGHRALWIAPFDQVSGKVSGPEAILVNGGTDLAKKPVWIEGPHLYKHDGWYILLAAEGGTGEAHSEVAFRSHSPTGPFVPYAGNPILTQRDLPADRADPVTSTGHADLVETEDGRWWSVFLGTRPHASTHGAGLYNTGRETFLLPVSWRDGWPVILPQAQPVPLIATRPALPRMQAPPQTGSFTWTDSFRRARLEPAWEMLRSSGEQWWQIDPRAGTLELKPREATLGSMANPSALLRRQQHGQFEVSVTLEGVTVQAAEAGLTAFADEKHFYALALRATAGKQQLVLEKQDGDTPRDTASEPLSAAQTRSLQLRIVGDGDAYSFLYNTGAADGTASATWHMLGPVQDGTILSTRHVGGFTGTMLGVYAHRLLPASQ